MTTEPGASLIGKTIGVYKVQSLLGAGGMGEVYRARDTRLGRDVAIKILSASMAVDAGCAQRFEREARLLAALNHTNIAAIHGLEERDGICALVLELVEGPTLADRVAAGPIQLKEALNIARQIAEALEAAHEKGIVHRDLKPANIKIALDGTVKVLDFGLAKAFATDAAGLDLSRSPVVTTAATRRGTLLGTPAYMSPEQARGQPTDKRTDIWAFGCVLYEELTGTAAFAAETLPDTIARILDREPNWRALPEKIPHGICRLLVRCLEKDPRRRLHDIADARIELDEALTEPARTSAIEPPAPAHATQRALLVGAACLLGVLAGATAIWTLGPEPPAATVARFAVALAPDEIVHPVGGNSVAISRDGARLAVVANNNGRTQIYVRSVGEVAAKPVRGTEGASGPFFSPDGGWLGFRHAATRTMRKVALSGGAPVTICPYNAGYGTSWELDDTILFNGDVPGPILRVSASGSTPQPVTELDPKKEDRNHYWPELLPGHRAVLFSTIAAGADTFDDGRIEVQSLTTRERRVLVEGGSYARYAPTGHVLYLRSGTLLAVPFDVQRLAVTGSPVPVLEGVSMGLNSPNAHYGLSATGTLAYAPGPAVGAERTVVWVDRQGNAERVPLPPAMYLHPRISPDGRQLAIEIEGPTHNLYTYDFGRGVLSRVALDGFIGADGFNGNNHWPVWTPRGERLTFRSWRRGGFSMWWMPADRSGPPERLTDIGTNQSASSWAPDGRVVAFTQVSSETGGDIYVLPVDRKPRPFAQTRFAEGSPKFSPDGRWIAYTSRESGRDQIYVQAYPGPGPKVQISNDGGTDAVWRRTGGELFYRHGDKMMAVSITTQPTFTASTPRMLWERRYAQGMSSTCGPPGPTSSNYDVTADGQRFLMIKDSDTESFPNQITVVLNWTEELRQSSNKK